MEYGNLLKEAQQQGVDIYEKEMINKGLYGDNVIWINKFLPTAAKYSILAEELGHHYKTVGNILDQSKLTNRKQEKLARTWAYERTIPLSKIVQAHKERLKNRYEFAEFLGVTEDFLEEALERYQDKHGPTVRYRHYTICFNPLGVIEWFDHKNF